MVGNMKLSGRPETQNSEVCGKGSRGKVQGGLPAIEGSIKMKRAMETWAPRTPSSSAGPS